MGQAVGEVRDLRLAALWGRRAAGVIRGSRCGGNSAQDDSDGKESCELRWVHGKMKVQLASRDSLGLSY